MHLKETDFVQRFFRQNILCVATGILWACISFHPLPYSRIYVCTVKMAWNRDQNERFIKNIQSRCRGFFFGKRKVMRNAERKRDRIQDDVPFDDVDKAILHTRMFLLCTANGKQQLSLRFVVLVPLLLRLLLLWLWHAQLNLCVSSLPCARHLAFGSSSALCWTKRSVHIFFFAVQVRLGSGARCQRPYMCALTWDAYGGPCLLPVCFGLASKESWLLCCWHIWEFVYEFCLASDENTRHYVLRLSLFLFRPSLFLFFTWLLLIVKKAVYLERIWTTVFHHFDIFFALSFFLIFERFSTWFVVTWN